LASLGDASIQPSQGSTTAGNSRKIFKFFFLCFVAALHMHLRGFSFIYANNLASTAEVPVCSCSDLPLLWRKLCAGGTLAPSLKLLYIDESMMMSF